MSNLQIFYNLYYNNDLSNSEIYGNLYNWYAIDDGRGLCMEGWHVPSNSEWESLVTYLGGDDIAGGKLKEVGTSHWDSPNLGATNESGFTALPAGWIHGSCPAPTNWTSLRVSIVS